MTTRRENMKVEISQKRVAKLPHELDESVDPNPPPLQPEIKQAAKDLARGLVDTDRALAVNVTYKKQKTRSPTEVT
jgi:hypothetical protein